MIETNEVKTLTVNTLLLMSVKQGSMIETK